MNWALQKAIVTKLAAYGATSGYTVVDNAHSTAFPFVRIGLGSRQEVGPCDALVWEEQVQIDVFDDGDSGHIPKVMADNIVAAMRDALGDAAEARYIIKGPWDAPDVVRSDPVSPAGNQQAVPDVNGTLDDLPEQTTEQSGVEDDSSTTKMEARYE